jgi:hypothetical protein
VVVSTTNLSGDKVEVQTMLPELYSKADGTSFMIPSDEKVVATVYNVD